MIKHMPNFNSIVDPLQDRASKETMLNQRACAFWFTGLSGAGKTTLAVNFEKQLRAQGFLVQVLDGDNIRLGINSDLGFSLADRAENIRRIAEVTKLFVQAGVITIISFISPTADSRAMARRIIGSEDFFEIFINAPLTVCEKRDIKGLYKKARAGLLPNFTGIDSPYESPLQADLEICTNKTSIEQSIDNLYSFAKPLITRS